MTGSEMDFRSPHVLEERIRVATEQVLIARGYDHSYVLNRSRVDSSATRPTRGR